MSFKPSNINNLQLLCSSKLCSVKDVQAESVLMMVHSLCANYFVPKNENDYEEDKYISKEEKEIILNFNKELFDYLNQKIMSFPRLQVVLNEANKNSQAFIKARLVEPLGFYYNSLANSFIGRLNYLTEKDDKQMYIPDMLALFLILDFKEQTGYTFEKFDYIFKQDLEKIAAIYFKVNYKIKKENNITYSTPLQEQTVINKMQNISSFMIKKLTEAKYNKSVKEVNLRIKNKKRGDKK